MMQHPEVPDSPEKPTNSHCDELVLVRLRQLRLACRAMIDTHSEYDCDGDCDLCSQTPFTILNLCEIWEAFFEGQLYQTPVVRGELQPAGGADVPHVLPCEPSPN